MRISDWSSDVCSSDLFSPLTAPGSAEGRDAIALACSDIAAGVTGRGRERLHRFRHLVALELLIPLFLSPEDADWMATLPVQWQGEKWPEVLLPRDLLGKVVEIGDRKSTRLNSRH